MIRFRVLRRALLVAAIVSSVARPGLAVEAPPAVTGVERAGMPKDLLAAVLAVEPSTAVYKVSQLPAKVLALSGMSAKAVADADKPYNTTDAVLDGSWPFERLVWGVRAGPYYLVNREVGGDASNAGVTAYRLDVENSDRFAWGAITMSFGQADGLSTYRTFADFRNAVRTGAVRGSTGNCVTWLSAPQDALRHMLLPEAGPVLADATQLPVGVRTMVDRRLVSQGRYHLQWAAPVQGGYVIQLAPTAEGKGRIAVIRTPVSQASDMLWLGSTGQFENYGAFQRKLKSTMSVEVEEAIMQGRCQSLSNGWSRPGSSPIIAPIAG